MKIVLLFGAAAVLAGCAAPKVKYDEAKAGDKGVRFQLAESLIKFDYAVEAIGPVKAENTSKLVIMSVPVPLETKTYTISGTGVMDNWGVKTAIKATHRNDTLLLQELGSEIADTRRQLISDVSSALVNAIPLFAAGAIDDSKSAKSKAPGAITLTELLTSKECLAALDGKVVCTDFKFPKGGHVADGGAPTPYTADVVISARPLNAIQAPTSFPFESDSVFYSACRTVTIQVKNTAVPDLQGSASVRVAEPGWVEQLRLPDKGKVIFGASCGADVVAEDAALPTTMDYVNTVLSSAKAIKEAKDKAKKEGAK
ncbi:MAG: hypothetical protein K2X55_12085 [Burkholderiaceae bacterium]|nr:hypothetical protein [Burkholderiaceae bacterium]